MLSPAALSLSLLSPTAALSTCRCDASRNPVAEDVDSHMSGRVRRRGSVPRRPYQDSQGEGTPSCAFCLFYVSVCMTNRLSLCSNLASLLSRAVIMSSVGLG